jgi:hypothetical protein
MKLTPAQIEIERKKFIEDFKHTNFYNLDRDDAGFTQSETFDAFIGWIACRESNNEITLSDMLPIDRVILKKSLESQGFTVKSQE